MTDPEDLAAVIPLILSRVEQGFGTTLEVTKSGVVQQALAVASQKRAQQAYDEYVANLARSQKNLRD